MYYFAYGSNLSKKRMKEVCPDSRPVRPATLPNHKLVFVDWSRQWKGGVATIQGSQGDKTRGAIYDISERDLRRLDSHEGHPANYNRIKVRVFDEEGTAIDAITYVKAGRVKETEPSPDYLAIMKEGYRDWGLFE